VQAKIEEVVSQGRRSQICDIVLRALPDWFGIDESIVDYVSDVRNMPFAVAIVDDNVVGFVALMEHNSSTAEIHIMGILPEYHRHGIGRQLVGWCEQFVVATEREFLTVKTLDKSRPNESYAKTRLFYTAMGFKPLEVFPLLWDPSNPCLFMAKYISDRCSAQHSGGTYNEVKPV